MATIADKSLDTLKPLLLPNYAAKVEAGFSKVNTLPLVSLVVFDDSSDSWVCTMRWVNVY